MIPSPGSLNEKINCDSLLRYLLPHLLSSCGSKDDQSSLCTEPRFVKSPKEAAKADEEIPEETAEGAEQDVQEQREEHPLSQETVLSFRQAIQPPPTTTSPS